MEKKDKLNEVNAHVLKAILDACHERVVLASRDIFDERGVKLLAQNKPLTDVLQQRLLERKLREPLEASLRFESGQDKAQLRQAFAQLLGSSGVLAGLVKPWAKALEEQIATLPLDPVVQFLLTTIQAATPPVFEHAVQAMALAGAMSARSGANPAELRLAMTAGLVHDIGELHLDPRLLGNTHGLNLAEFRQLVTHPRLGELWLTGLKQYPLALARAVGEHHERLDGSGYPQARSLEAISPLGRMLAVVETTLGVLAKPDASLARASFALRVVPGEYDGQWVGMVASAAAAAPVRAAEGDSGLTAQAWEGLARCNHKMTQASTLAQSLSASAQPAVRMAALHAAHLLERLRVGWNEMGLWTESLQYGQDPWEVVMADEELRYRLSVLERDCLVLQGDLEEAQALQLAPLWQCLAD